jgi:hypothetical protein
MMNSKKCLAFLIDNIDSGNNIKETLEELSVFIGSDSFSAESIRNALSEFDHSENSGWSIYIRDGEYSEISLADIDGEDLNILIKKPVGGRLFFATLNGFLYELDREELLYVKEILVLQNFSEFCTRRYCIKPWDGELIPSLPRQENGSDEVDPRIGLVRDLTAKKVPADPYRWLLTGPISEGELWSKWQKIAVLKLSTILVSEVWAEDVKTKVSIHGSRKIVFNLDDSLDDPTFYRQLKEAVEWLLVRQDADARHEVLIRRLATLLWQDEDNDSSWIVAAKKVLKEALDGARLDHKAYIRFKSTEAVKAVAELRKAVGEDISKITSRIHRLANGFIVGLAALAAGLGVRLTLITSNGSWEWSGLVFCIVVLSVTWTGILLQRYISSSSLVSDLCHMRSWHRSVHVALSRAEYKDLALRPILDAIQLYKRTIKLMHIGLVVSSIIFFLGFIGLPAIHSGGQEDASSQQEHSESIKKEE